ncbi:MAG TPA: hypothetical protein H9705_02365 [Candidatus Fusicatenibacter intestinigallinarum]|uniref:DUF2383 domain-containing protein n=1 Tax=Candidatus Fusicatenibacter intestinigallinarum TaxID=2838598 RepID=A0A9D2N8W2_9FIRM|nr:hypothetical protein [Candidatus Fusicatenibacter intestinigallinarum]
MNDNARLLNFVYQNAQMGVDSIRQLMGIVENKELKEHLKTQFQGYEEFQNTARQMLEENGFDEKEISAFSKISTYLMINMQLLTDKSATHIAEMMIQGSNMGVIDAIKNLNECEDAEQDIRNLMEKLQKFEEHNIEKLKEFL